MLGPTFPLVPPLGLARARAQSASVDGAVYGEPRFQREVLDAALGLWTCEGQGRVEVGH